MKRYVRLSFLLVFLCATVVLPQSLRVRHNSEIWNHQLYPSKMSGISLAVRYNNKTRYAALWNGQSSYHAPYSLLKVRHGDQTWHALECAYQETRLNSETFSPCDYLVRCNSRLVVGRPNSKVLSFYDSNGQSKGSIHCTSLPKHAAAEVGSDDVYVLFSDKYIRCYNTLSGTSFSFTYNFSNPVKIALGSSAIFVADRGAGRVFKFNPSGAYLSSFEGPNLSDLKAICTLGGYLFIASGSNIYKYSSDGTYVGSIASPAPITDMNQWGNTLCLATTNGIYRLRSNFSLLGSTPMTTGLYSITYFFYGMLAILRSDGIWRID